MYYLFWLYFPSLFVLNQNQEVTSDQEITVAATSIAVTEILDQLNIPAKQVVGIPQSDSYTVPKINTIHIPTISNVLSFLVVLSFVVCFKFLTVSSNFLSTFPFELIM